MNPNLRDYYVKCAIERAAIPPHIDPGKACVYYTHHMSVVLLQHGYLATLVAGSTLFEAIPPEFDDGVSPTHYSYICDPTANWGQIGMLPEVHCWTMVKIDGKIEIIDLTVKHIPQLAQSLGIEWKAPTPPEYLWCDIDSIPKGWVYTPDARATNSIKILMRLNPHL